MKQAHLFKILLGTIVLVSTIQNVHANCATTGVGNATGGGDTVQCSLFDNNGYVGTGSGDDITILTGSNTTNNIDTINGAAGADIITVLGGTITSIIAGDAILGGPGNDVIVVNAGVINGVNHGINGATGQDTITINGGTITAINNAAIRGASGADTILP